MLNATCYSALANGNIFIRHAHSRVDMLALANWLPGQQAKGTKPEAAIMPINPCGVGNVNWYFPRNTHAQEIPKIKRQARLEFPDFHIIFFLNEQKQSSIRRLYGLWISRGSFVAGKLKGTSHRSKRSELLAPIFPAQIRLSKLILDTKDGIHEGGKRRNQFTEFRVVHHYFSVLIIVPLPTKMWVFP